MKDSYFPREIEAKWQRIWETQETFKAIAKEDKPKFYMLEMFPYPSGRIHMGHVRNYAIGDVLARFKWKNGFKVLHPMGWDAFGLPAENAAIERNVHPGDWTFKNIKEMRSQLKSLGMAYDWSREIATCHPDYYKFEQLVFCRAYEKGLVYRKTALVNWSEKMQTVLANEQVIDGMDYRYGLPVVQKELTQWFFKTTAYAEELLAGIEEELVGNWPERVLLEQRSRIGKSHGAEVKFRLEEPIDGDGELPIFTTRPDTLYGVTFMSLAPEHPMALNLVRGTPEENSVREFVNKVKAEDKHKRGGDDYEKEGIFTGKYCINPINDSKVPIYIANFVLMDYGTGAVMAVPAHDQRDFEFARKYDIPIRVVIEPEGETLTPDTMNAAYLGDGIQVNSGPFDGMPNREAIDKIPSHLAEQGIGGRTINYRLRDWCVSRQRYWGAPIPVVHCGECGPVTVPEDQLPVTLPQGVEFKPDGGSPLAACEEFVDTNCPKCGGAAKRETDTFDTFVESSWYHLRYTSPRHEDAIVDDDEVKEWMPIDQYIGGIEHAVGHLVYSRFYHQLLRDLGMVPMEVPKEPFSKLLTQGMVCMETLYTLDEKNQPVWHYPGDVEDGVSKLNGKKITVGRLEKMSKSKRNTVDTTEILAKYGVDSARMFTLFASPPENDVVWRDEGVEGIYRFLSRLYRIVRDRLDGIRAASPYSGDGSNLTDGATALRKLTHKTASAVTSDIDKRFHLNTAIAKCMELTNLLSKFQSEDDPGRSVERDAVFTLIGLLTPFAPHFAEEVWENIADGGTASMAPWPTWDEGVAADDMVTIAVQVMGKLRAKLEMPRDASRDELEKAALADSNVQKHIGKNTVRKIIVVPGKLVNIVAN